MGVRYNLAIEAPFISGAAQHLQIHLLRAVKCIGVGRKRNLVVRQIHRIQIIMVKRKIKANTRGILWHDQKAGFTTTGHPLSAKVCTGSKEFRGGIIDGPYITHHIRSSVVDPGLNVIDVLVLLLRPV